MREEILRDVASRASSDPAFLAGVRKDPEGTLSRYGYNLTPDEMGTILDLRRRTASLGDGMVAALLAGGLKHTPPPPPPRPGRPERSRRAPARTAFGPRLARRPPHEARVPRKPPREVGSRSTERKPREVGYRPTVVVDSPGRFGPGPGRNRLVLPVRRNVAAAYIVRPGWTGRRPGGIVREPGRGGICTEGKTSTVLWMPNSATPTARSGARSTAGAGDSRS